MHRLLMLNVPILLVFAFANSLLVQISDTRAHFIFDEGNRAIRSRDGKTWQEWKDDKLERTFVERERTPDYIELATNAPQSARIRLYARKVYWRLESEVNWREGKAGRWRPD